MNTKIKLLAILFLNGMPLLSVGMLTLQTHIKQNPQITQSKNIVVFLDSINNKTGRKIQVGIRPSKDQEKQIAIIPQNKSLTLVVPLPITRPNCLMLLPDPIGSINDGLQTIYFTNAGDNIAQSTKNHACLNVWIDKTTNTLKPVLIRTDDQDEFLMPFIKNNLALGDTKSFYISVTLEGDNFEKSQIIDTSIKKGKGRMNDLGE
jgi:hypothetical protein